MRLVTLAEPLQECSIRFAVRDSAGPYVLRQLADSEHAILRANHSGFRVEVPFSQPAPFQLNSYVRGEADRREPRPQPCMRLGGIDVVDLGEHPHDRAQLRRVARRANKLRFEDIERVSVVGERGTREVVEGADGTEGVPVSTPREERFRATKHPTIDRLADGDALYVGVLGAKHPALVALRSEPVDHFFDHACFTIGRVAVFSVNTRDGRSVYSAMEIEEFLKAQQNCLKCGCASLCSECGKCEHCPSCSEQSERRNAWAKKTVYGADLTWPELSRMHKLEATKTTLIWMLCMVGWSTTLGWVLGAFHADRFVWRLLAVLVATIAWFAMERRLAHMKKHREALKAYGERVKENGWATDLPEPRGLRDGSRLPD